MQFVGMFLVKLESHLCRVFIYVFSHVTSCVQCIQDEKVKGVKVADYDYLLSMPIGSLTYEKVQQLRGQRDKMEEEVEELKRATPEALWIKDLDEFLVKLDVSLVRLKFLF